MTVTKTQGGRVDDIPDARYTADPDTLVHDLLQCGTRPEPGTAFLIRVGRILLDFARCDAVQMWILETDHFSRWEVSRSPERLTRMRDVPTSAVARGDDTGARLYGDSVAAYSSLLAADMLEEVLGEETVVPGQGSIVLVPLSAGEEMVGYVMYKSLAPLDAVPLGGFLHVSRTLAFVISFQRLRLQQRERVKELTCLYHIGKATSDSAATLDVLMQRIVDCLPPAWQYPDITRARIVLDDRLYETPGAGRERHVQRSPILVGGDACGVVEVAYMEERPDLDEGPFLKEERRLIDLVAGDIAQVVEQKRAETEREALMQQVRHADRLATIGKLAAGVAHELNEPLGSILGFAQLARGQGGIPDQVDADLERIERASLYAREVIRKLMLFARQTRPAKRTTSLNALIQDAVGLLDSRARSAGVRIVSHMSDDVPEMTVDPGQVVQVVVNLAVNAIQAMPEGGTLDIESSRTADEVVLSVRDTGAGIDPQIRDRIFDPFFTTKDVREGTGLGLAVVHGIVTAHGGHIEVDSEVGRGSRFDVHLPIRGLVNGS